MSTLTEIAEGLAARLRAIPALDDNVLTSVRRPSVYPAVIVVPPSIPEYGDSLASGGGRLDLPLLVLVSSVESEKQQSLFPFIDWAGPASIPAAIEASRDLGLGDVDCRVNAATEPGLVELPDGTTAYGITLNVLVFAT